MRVCGLQPPSALIPIHLEMLILFPFRNVRTGFNGVTVIYSCKTVQHKGSGLEEHREPFWGGVASLVLSECFEGCKVWGRQFTHTQTAAEHKRVGMKVTPKTRSCPLHHVNGDGVCYEIRFILLESGGGQVEGHGVSWQNNHTRFTWLCELNRVGAVSEPHFSLLCL